MTTQLDRPSVLPKQQLSGFWQRPLHYCFERLVTEKGDGRMRVARGGFGAPFSALQQGIEVVRFFGFPEKLVIDIKMFVFAFAHCSRKALEINRINQPNGRSCAL